ncbi:GNAT family N-acetyltransferase [Corallibacter sp.]|uniref:GNAT family N-acetyltransferase n=1 Tax=Corallibacter sp. TaxID=2038084 RepID=UPI003AB16CB9
MLSAETFYLAPLNLDDASSLNSLMISNGKRFQAYLPKTLEQNISESASKAYISKKNKEIKEQSEFTFAIKDKDTHNVAGLVILKNLDWNKKQGEFAYCLGSKYSGNGWMTKSIKAAKAYAFDELGLETLQIIIHKTNKTSIRVAERNGFTWKQTLEKEYVTGKSTLDMELYESKKQT